MNPRVHAPAAVIAAALANTDEWLSGSQCIDLATAAGYPRSDARAALEWAVSAGLLRRREGARTARWHQLARPPHPAGAVGELAKTGVRGA